MKSSRWLHAPLYAAAFLLAMEFPVHDAAQVVSGNGERWLISGQDLGDTRNQSAEHTLGPWNVAKLTPKWIFTTAGNVSATPAVYGDSVYFPDWSGNLYAVDKSTGQPIWSARISDYDGVPGAISRNTPAIHGDELIFGDIQPGIHKGANLIAVN